MLSSSPVLLSSSLKSWHDKLLSWESPSQSSLLILLFSSTSNEYIKMISLWLFEHGVTCVKSPFEAFEKQAVVHKYTHMNKRCKAYILS